MLIVKFFTIFQKFSSKKADVELIEKSKEMRYKIFYLGESEMQIVDSYKY